MAYLYQSPSLGYYVPDNSSMVSGKWNINAQPVYRIDRLVLTICLSLLKQGQEQIDFNCIN